MAIKVLTVDDSKTIRMIVKKAFKPYDCEIFEAENGQEGFSLAAAEKPDLIVLDITMPVMNGVECLEKLKSEPNLKDTPVIMLTAESGKDNVMQIVKMGVKDYIVKPFKGEELIERARNYISIEDKQEKAEPDASRKYFSVDGDTQILNLPGKIDRPVTAEIDGILKIKTGNMITSGIPKLIMNMTKVAGSNMSLIKWLIDSFQLM